MLCSALLGENPEHIQPCSVYIATCQAKECHAKFIGSTIYGLTYYIQGDKYKRHDDFTNINQAIKSRNLKQAIYLLKINSDLAALLWHYKKHEDFHNDDMEFWRMFKDPMVTTIYAILSVPLWSLTSRQNPIYS